MIDFVPKVRLDLVVEDGQVDSVVEAIQSARILARLEDGKIFVLEVAQAVRIRTGETGATRFKL